MSAAIAKAEGGVMDAARQVARERRTEARVRSLDAADIAQEIMGLEDLRDELLAALKWMVDNDETNEGDEPLDNDLTAGMLGVRPGATWNEINAYWIEGLNRARAAIAKAEGTP